MQFNQIEAAIDDIRNGKMVIVVDDQNRENEGDIVMAAEKVTPYHINFMASHAKGLICVPITKERAQALSLNAMVDVNRDRHQTAFTVSVDHASSTTGISAFERAKTVNALASPNAHVDEFIQPGHMFPLVGRNGGVLERAGHTEASIDLATLAGLDPSGCICEIMREDGHMARLPELIEFAQKWDLKMISIQDLIKYRRNLEKSFKKVAQAKLPTQHGEFELIAFENDEQTEHHVALVKGPLNEQPALVRIHSECLTGDAFHSLRCDCGEQLERSLEMIHAEGSGVVIYMRQEGRGIGLVNKIRAYALQDQGKDTVEANLLLGFSADLREYRVCAHILKILGIQTIKLITNNPLKVSGLEMSGIEVTQRIPLQVGKNAINQFYLETKKQKMGHHLVDDELQAKDVDPNYNHHRRQKK